MLTFASNFNIVSMVMLTLMQRMGIEPILCICNLLQLPLIIFENVNVDIDAKCEWAFTLLF